LLQVFSAFPFKTLWIYSGAEDLRNLEFETNEKLFRREDTALAELQATLRSSEVSSAS
jgi:hypothetical protein